MTFNWYEPRPGACEPDCRGWIAAVGVITNDTPKIFDEFAQDRAVTGTTVVLDSSGGSVVEAIALGRRLRDLNVKTTVGTVVEQSTARGSERAILPDAYCESMCAFVLLSGKTRYVPEGAHVRVHQIWMGDRADHAQEASYTAQDLTIIQRDIGRLAKYTFDMGGAGDLLALALGVAPWEPLRELSVSELHATNLVSSDAVANAGPAVLADRHAGLDVKPIQDRLVPGNEPKAVSAGTKTAEAIVPTGGAATAPPRQ